MLPPHAVPLWVCEGAFDALALFTAGVPRVVAIFGVQGWHWDWVREVRDMVFALDADAAGQQAGRTLARQAALRGKRVAVLPATAYGGCKDVSEAWMAGELSLRTWSAASASSPAALAGPKELREAWEEPAASMVYEGKLPCPAAERLAWVTLSPHGAKR